MAGQHTFNWPMVDQYDVIFYRHYKKASMLIKCFVYVMVVLILNLSIFYPRREGTLGCLLHKYPKFYNNDFLFVDLTTLRTHRILIGWLSVQTFLPKIVIWGCTSIYRALFYPFRSLIYVSIYPSIYLSIYLSDGLTVKRQGLISNV